MGHGGYGGYYSGNVSESKPKETNNCDAIGCFVLFFIGLFFLLAICLISSISQPKDNVLYYTKDKCYFYRCGAKFVRYENGWKVFYEYQYSKHDHRVIEGFIEDPDFKMPGEVSRKKS